MVKNVILVKVRETANYKWYTMYLENEKREINIFYPASYDGTADVVEEEWKNYFAKCGRPDNWTLPAYAFKCYAYARMGEDKLKMKIIEKWPNANIYCLDGFAVAPCCKKEGYGFKN